VAADDEDREYEGDVTMAAAKINPEAIHFVARERTTTGICGSGGHGAYGH
jgi:3,4-dihydroxy-2-butanone 4-phosphate synthase